MARVDYSNLITEIVQPQLVDSVVNKKMDKLFSLFTQNNNVAGGSRITDPNVIAKTAAGGAFTRADADPVSLTQTFINPYWNKLYYHEAFNVRREDIDEKKAPSAEIALVSDAAMVATELLMEHVYDGVMTQIKADVDSAADYSDGAETRVTALTSYEENTNATITLAYMRGAQNAIAMKDTINWGDYVWLLEQTVMNSAHPLMSATGSWVEQNPRQGGSSSNTGGSRVATGYMPVASFDGIPVDTSFGMTVGDCFLLKRADVQIQTHKGLEVEMKSVDEYGIRGVVRIGVNGWVRRPAFAGKLTLKD